MTEWYRKIYGETSGPFTLEEFQYLKARGKLAPGDEVREGVSGPWIEAGSIDAVFEPQIVPASASAAAESEPKTTPESTSDATNDDLSDTVNFAPHVPAVLTEAKRPPPLPRNRDTTKQVLLGSGIGIGIVLLLVLLIFLLRGDAGGEGGTVADSGIGSGAMTGAGHGAGAGGAGDSDSDGTSASPESSEGTAGETKAEGQAEGGGATSVNSSTEGQPREELSGEVPPEKPPDETGRLTIQQLPSGTQKASDSAGGGGNSGGGSGSGEGTSFFDVEAKGSRFVYIVDCSSSMAGMGGLAGGPGFPRRSTTRPRTPFKTACDEVMESVKALDQKQSFFVMFFSDQNFPMFYPQPPQKRLLTATRSNIRRLEQWVNTLQSQGNTNPFDSLMTALDLPDVDAIFLLTDGEFDPSIVDAIRNANTRKIPINTIAFIGRSGEPLLKEIAKQNGGTYRFVP